MRGRELALGPLWCPGLVVAVTPGGPQAAGAAADQEDIAPPHTTGGLALVVGLAAGRMGTVLLQVVRDQGGPATQEVPELEVALADSATTASDEV